MIVFSCSSLGASDPRGQLTRQWRPGRELAAIAAYLVLFAVAFLGWGLSALRGAVPGEPAQSIVLLVAKLGAMVLFPTVLLVAMGCDLRRLLRFDWPDRVERRALLVMGALLLLLQLTAGRGPKMIAALPQPAWAIALAAPFALVWMSLEAGLTEEFLFRVAFQTRAAAWLRPRRPSCHDGGPGSARPRARLRAAWAHAGVVHRLPIRQCRRHSIVVVSPIGLAGVLWARTRSLVLVVLLHGWADLVPNLAEFVRTWSVSGGNS
jgi:hypothetical protein